MTESETKKQRSFRRRLKRLRNFALFFLFFLLSILSFVFPLIPLVTTLPLSIYFLSLASRSVHRKIWHFRLRHPKIEQRYKQWRVKRRQKRLATMRRSTVLGT